MVSDFSPASKLRANWRMSVSVKVAAFAHEGSSRTAEAAASRIAAAVNCSKQIGQRLAQHMLSQITPGLYTAC